MRLSHDNGYPAREAFVKLCYLYIFIVNVAGSCACHSDRANFVKKMDSPPLGPKPKSALPSYLINGSSPLHTSADTRERDNLAASIDASTGRRQLVDLDISKDTNSNGNDSWFQKTSKTRPIKPPSQSHITEAARDPRDEAPPPTPTSASRPASPYTLNPPIDFDGLSWPSTSDPIFFFVYIVLRGCDLNRSGYKTTARSDAGTRRIALGEASRCCENHPGMCWRGSRKRGPSGYA